VRAAFAERRYEILPLRKRGAAEEADDRHRLLPACRSGASTNGTRNSSVSFMIVTTTAHSAGSRCLLLLDFQSA